MKKLILSLSLSLFLCFNLHAEEEVYVIDGFPTIEPWISERYFNDWPKMWYVYTHTQEGTLVFLDYKLIGDTVIHAKSYARVGLGYETKADLLRNEDLFISRIHPAEATTYADTLYFRQEGDKVFYLSEPDGSETVIVDYGLSKNDEFVDGAGERFKVTRAAKTYFSDCWKKNINFHYYEHPREIRLVSERTGEEDVWLEGVGSLRWGILPDFIVNNIPPLKTLGLHVGTSKMVISNCSNMYVHPCIDEPDYKAMEIKDRGYSSTGESSMTFSFIGDTLFVKGSIEKIWPTGYSYAECIIDGDNIDVMIKELKTWSDDTRKGYLNFDVKIPGFKSGTYQVGLVGKEHVSLNCTGTDGIKETYQVSSSSSPIFDLSGRQATRPRQKGIYIKDGKKVVVGKD